MRFPASLRFDIRQKTPQFASSICTSLSNDSSLDAKRIEQLVRLSPPTLTVPSD
jgi:hypothetical protein